MAWQKTMFRVRCVAAALNAICFCLIQSACTTPQTTSNKPASPSKAKKDDAPSNAKKVAATPPVDVGFLLSMTYQEAKLISPASAQVLPNYQVAGDTVKVTSTASDGQAQRATAKGHVYLQIDFGDQLIALGQEALVGGSEVILRGKPLLKRGRTVVEGLEDTTVFFITGTRLQVVGKHRITTDKEVTSSWPNSWKEGPNPLLPALSPNDVPKEMRASPLLPSLKDDAASKVPR